MKELFRRAAALIALLLLAPLAAPLAGPQGVGAFRLQLDEKVFEAPFTGSLFVAFGGAQREPRAEMHGWFNAPPVMRFEVESLKGEIVVTQADAAASSPADWTTVQRGPVRVQAIARLSLTGRQAGLSQGDAFSEVVEIDYDPDSEGVVALRLSKTAAEPKFAETERIRLFEFVSPALSKFYGFDYTMRAGVLLPRNYGERDSYPVVYAVTGFGGTHASISGWESRVPAGSAVDEAIVVVPDASNLYGHSVFCDSDSIGPWGQALVHELIPELEREFGGAGAEHRYTTGVSSGGWSSLWLQVAYPDEFAGCWSHVPDPIDFYDFQQINLYEPLADGSPRNMYVDEKGEKRPVARNGDSVMLLYEDFVRREHVLNPGGQIRSFEGTFSPLGTDGTPRRVFDVETGVIDHEAAQAWRRYDISHILLTRWDELRPSLAGKIHVYAGEVDTFYLEGAVERFMGLAEEAGLLDEMVVEVIPGMAHSLHQAGHQDMIETIGKRWSEADL